MPRTPPAGSRRPRLLKVTDAFRDFVLAQLETLGELDAKAMFGGVGLYHRGVFFGVLTSDTLYFKTDDRTRAAYTRRGAAPLRPHAEQASRTYFAVPLDVLESAPELAAWARDAVAAAERRAVSGRGAPARSRSARRASPRPADRQAAPTDPVRGAAAPARTNTRASGRRSRRR
jgi:DNA transformation protein and related proteins